MRPYAIFDLDGTLIDSMYVWKHIGEDYLKAKALIPPKDLANRLKTMTMMESASYFRNELGIELDEKEIIYQINQMVADKYAQEVQLKTYVKNYIECLKQQGTKMCILTASERVNVEAILKRCGILDKFECILTCTELGLSKASPEIFKTAARQLAQRDVSLEEVMVFEDALHAIQQAKQAGCYVIGVYDESAQKDQEQIKEICDQYIISFEELV
ncbi:MAG: HAD family hydrolase [Cellulosilyticaceae bacterium]